MNIVFTKGGLFLNSLLSGYLMVVLFFAFMKISQPMNKFVLPSLVFLKASCYFVPM